MRKQCSSNRGFTVVEVIITIAVIAILVAVTTITYRDVQRRAVASVLQSELQDVATHLRLVQVDTGLHPTAYDELPPPSDNVIFRYTSDGTTYCLTAVYSRDNTLSYHISDTTTISNGVCPGHAIPNEISITGVATPANENAQTTTVNAPAASSLLIVVTSRSNLVPSSLSLGGQAATLLYAATPDPGGVVGRYIAYWWIAAAPTAGTQSLTLPTHGDNNRTITVIGIDGVNPASPVRGSAWAGSMSGVPNTAVSLSPMHKAGDLVIMTGAIRNSDTSLLSSSLNHQAVLTGPRSPGHNHSMIIITSSVTPIEVNNQQRYGAYAALTLRR